MSRLSELLDRIRPAGTPGAPSEREGIRDDAMSEQEFASIAAAVAAFEREADALVTEATDEAVRIGDDADRRSRAVVSGLPDRVSVAQATAGAERQDESGLERDRLATESAREVARLRAAADEQIPGLVSAVLDLIWASAATTAAVAPEATAAPTNGDGR